MLNRKTKDLINEVGIGIGVLLLLAELYFIYETWK
jgi:hypothetical protein